MTNELLTTASLVEDVFVPEKTALIVIDVQNDFCAPGGFYDRVGYPLGSIHTAIDRIETVLAAARAKGIMPVFIQAIYDPEFVSEAWTTRLQRHGFPLDVCQSGTWGSEFYRVGPEADEAVVVKHRYSAFQKTELDALLKEHGITSLIFCGVATNNCVESSFRDGFMMDYHVMLVEDSSATYDKALQDAAADNMLKSYGYVTTSDQLISAWRA
jgi:ureidoacrylate peracid hydrolase